MLYFESSVATSTVRLSGRSAPSWSRRVLTFHCPIISSCLLCLLLPSSRSLVTRATADPVWSFVQLYISWKLLSKYVEVPLAFARYKRHSLGEQIQVSHRQDDVQTGLNYLSLLWLVEICWEFHTSTALDAATVTWFSG